MKEWFKEFYQNNRFALLGCAIGLIVAILMLTINFWRTLLIIILVALGYTIGKLKDEDKSVVQFFYDLYQRIFRKN